jgi:hypothetical protein
MLSSGIHIYTHVSRQIDYREKRPSPGLWRIMRHKLVDVSKTVHYLTMLYKLPLLLTDHIQDKMFPVRHLGRTRRMVCFRVARQHSPARVRKLQYDVVSNSVCFNPQGGDSTNLMTQADFRIPEIFNLRASSGFAHSYYRIQAWYSEPRTTDASPSRLHQQQC